MGAREGTVARVYSLDLVAVCIPIDAEEGEALQRGSGK